MTTPFGLYIHIPFCAKLCHYCDFAKTANFSDDHVKSYFDLLHKQLKLWFEANPSQKFSSVFFGGGTPGLFGKEYTRLFELLHPHIMANAEVSLEANPHNVTAKNLKTWRSLGVNRLSVGVQSFNQQGLSVMTRDHSDLEAQRSVELALAVMPHVNLDLIYGWPGQTLEGWKQDLNAAVATGVQHVSLYALTFEGNTPFARAERRGKIIQQTDERLASYYNEASAYLRDEGFEHEEVSNWSRPGHSCDHNWLYWSAEFYLGLGAGAHGFIPSDQVFGYRYSYPKDLRSYLKLEGVDINEGRIPESDRTKESLLYEYVGCGLRTNRGVDLPRLRSLGYTFTPTTALKAARSESLVLWDETSIRLAPKEWFREIAWSSLVLDSFS